MMPVRYKAGRFWRLGEIVFCNWLNSADFCERDIRYDAVVVLVSGGTFLS